MVFIESPIVRMKGRKNEVEIEGMKAANKRDSVALCEFLAFMEEEVRRTCAHNGGTFSSFHLRNASVICKISNSSSSTFSTFFFLY